MTLKRTPPLAKSLPGRVRQRVFLEYTALTERVLEFEGVKLRVKKSLSPKIKKSLCYGYYEFEELQILAAQLAQQDVVMELGTGLGLISSFCAKTIGSDRVFTFEGNPSLQALISDTYQLNQVNPQIDFCLLTEFDGNQTFYVEQDFWVSSTVQHTEAAQAITVPCKAFNREIQRINPSFLIVDIEGGEYELFQFADLCNVKKLLIELHHDILDEHQIDFIKQKLQRLGFAVNPEFSLNNVYFWQR